MQAPFPLGKSELFSCGHHLSLPEQDNASAQIQAGGGVARFSGITIYLVPYL